MGLPSVDKPLSGHGTDCVEDSLVGDFASCSEVMNKLGAPCCSVMHSNNVALIEFL